MFSIVSALSPDDTDGVIDDEFVSISTSFNDDELNEGVESFIRVDHLCPQDLVADGRLGRRTSDQRADNAISGGCVDKTRRIVVFVLNANVEENLVASEVVQFRRRGR